MALSEDQARQELAELFHAAVVDHPDVMAECLAVLRLYNLAPSTFFYKYEAFCLSRPSGLRTKLSKLTIDTVRELRKEIQREQQVKSVGAMGSTGNSEHMPNFGVGLKKGRGNVGDLGGFLDGLSTPTRPAKAPRTGAGVEKSKILKSANALLPSATVFTHTSNGTYSTPQRASPVTGGPSGGSYRPGAPHFGASDRLVPLESPMGSNGDGISAPFSPVNGHESPSMLMAKPAQSFHLRPQPRSLIETLNPHLPSSADLSFQDGIGSGSKPRVSLSSASDPKKWNYRYMYEKISQRSEALDDVIDDFAEQIKEAYGITELGDPHFVSEDPIYTVGRILSPPTDTSKLSAASLFLESSRLLGSGKRIPLRFALPGSLHIRGGAPGVKSFGVFPGCLVCVKGRNGGGGAFIAEEILMPPPSAPAQSPIPELLTYQHGEKLAGQPVSMIVASGPYTLDDDLLYAPLDALIDLANDDPPDVLILLGPFVDAQHPMIASGVLTQSVTELFRDQISARLQRLAESSPRTVVIVVPSVRDAISRHVVYPQGMLDRELLGLPKRIRPLPNPCTFAVNEIVISLATVDVLFHLRREEVLQRAQEAEPDPELKGGEVKDAMAGLIRHVLGQRSFYPIFPPPEPHAADVNLDVTHYPLLRMDGPAPDVLILPSKLKHFSKIVDSTLVINPAQLSRAHSAGTFAKVLVHPTPEADLQSRMNVDGELALSNHGIWNRARSEMWRI